MIYNLVLSWLSDKLSNNRTNIALGLCGICAATGFAYIIFKSYGYQFAKTASESSCQRTSRNTSESSKP